MSGASLTYLQSEGAGRKTGMDVDHSNEEYMEAPLFHGSAGDRVTPEYTEFSNPLYLLKTSLEDRVSVLLQNNSSITGLLASFDEHMNLILINAEETGHSLNRFFPLLVIRGDSIIFVTRRRFTSIT
ncbi:putative U6 snRNA-associated Sm-like protein LSm3 [Giardia duodenalis]|uniref:U6 snRNA-associated Sm-like protein LSm3 n=1 Tax=Giardia intestinalis (strain ATCC 50803 / WB clone C6) TaxID=184922 RepID=A8B4P7_GIAIC|nr:putative U6 snRNA-associated Sm-like protein LSm3 [Giardia intestinalis]KAE8303733.1 putative U6 snRNA-associated Sm-like protein LSm3 [Giardia intestinalis]|eukprot:XP_001709658.1 U6 snRNA-associated Sm-like protein LSm3, putative [Giardia lamblia ATCC 50803]